MRHNYGGKRHRGTHPDDHKLRASGLFRKRTKPSSTAKRIYRIGEEIKRALIFELVHT